MITSPGQGIQVAVRAIVLEALAGGVQQTLPTNARFRDELGIAAGTMQRALDQLRDRGAITTVSRGHLGRFIVSIDVGQCWQAAGLAPVRLLLPPSGPVEIDVLDGRLAEELTRLRIPHTVHHLRGGARRMEAVRSGAHDLAVVSAGTFAAASASKSGSGFPTGLVRELETGTYYAPGRLVVVRRADGIQTAPLRVAIDRDSPDHIALTEGEFPEGTDHVYVDSPFPAVPSAVLRKTVDVGIWHETTSVIPLDLAGLSTNGLRTDADELVSGAVLLASPARPELAGVLSDLLLDDVLARQTAALESDEA